jgi:sulfur-oxidizing protein SoxX
MRIWNFLRLSAHVFALQFVLIISSTYADDQSVNAVKNGRNLTLEFCQACHNYEGTEQAGTVAPPLFNMKARFPDKQKLYNIIYDPTAAIKPYTMMPPFGKNELLSQKEIGEIIAYLYTL